MTNETEEITKPYEQPVQAENPFFTNAPEDWGVFENNFLDNEHAAARNSLVLMRQINESFKKTKDQSSYLTVNQSMLETKQQYATSCCIQKLFEKGCISIAGIAIDNYERYAVIILEIPTPMSYIDELKDYFIKEGYKDLVYFSAYDPSQVTTTRALEFDHFGRKCFYFDETKQSAKDRNYDEYAMWWSGVTDPDFETSQTVRDIGVYLELIDGYSTYSLGVLLYAFKMKDGNGRTKLPVYDDLIVTGPEGVEIIVSLSQQKGINFHFPTLPQYERYRDNFIKVYISFCAYIMAEILESNLSKDDDSTQSTAYWYKNLLEVANNSDEKVNAIGLQMRAKA